MLTRILIEDWKTQATIVERMVVLTYRLRHWGVTRTPRGPWLALAVLLAPLEFLVRVMTSGQISARATFGRRLRVPHPWGIVVHPTAVVGDDCTLFHQVTLGVNEHRMPHVAPRIGDGVYIGAGAKMIGNITVGDRAVIGANAVVVRDVPADHVAVGIPATCKPRPDRTRPPEEPEATARA